MTMAPEKMPPTPMPAIARPMMRAVLDGATAHMSEPNSKMPIAVKKVPLICGPVPRQHTVEMVSEVEC